LLENLRQNIQEAYNDFAAADAAAVAAFNDQKDRLKTVLQRLAAQHERLQNKLEALGQLIGTQSAIQ
jgi:histidinol-phosphate/aromatic aminotransferase/cobyric acid decarboxylase-like protein